MSLSLIILSALLPVFLILSLGAIFRRADWLPPVIDPIVTRLIIRVLYPCFVFGLVYGNEALKDPSIVVLAMVWGFISVVLGYVLGLLAGRLVLGSWGNATRAVALTVGVFNYGYFAIPLCLALFGPEVTGVLLVFNVGVEIALWIGAGFLVPSPEDKMKRPNVFKLLGANFLNPPVVAILLAIGFNSLSHSFRVPVFLLETIRLMGLPAVPLALLLIGAVLFDLTRNRGWWKDWKIPCLGLGLRLGVIPLVILFLASLTQPSDVILAVLVIQAGLPSGIFPIVILKMRKGDTLSGMRVILSTVLAGLVISPIWITIGIRWLGLAPGSFLLD